MMRQIPITDIMVTADRISKIHHGMMITIRTVIQATATAGIPEVHGTVRGIPTVPGTGTPETHGTPAVHGTVTGNGVFLETTR